MPRTLDVASLTADYAAGRSPAAVIDAVYDRLAAVDDPGIFITLVDRAAAKAAAEALGAYDPARPLWGVPFAVKDNIDVAGLPTTAACPAFSYMPATSAPAVARLLEAGAILVGKTNLDQFATGLVGLRTPYPAPRNAYDPAIVPGGSSSGSAVAVAQGVVAFALGTDTAGSGRVPAALNNIVGLKPSLGTVSGRGMVPACRTLDTISVFAGSVDDAWRVYETIAGYDPEDPFSRPAADRSLTSARPRLGVPRAADLEFFGDDHAARAFADALAAYGRLPVDIAEVDMRPFLNTGDLLYNGPWIAERHAALRAFLASNASDVHPVTRGIVEGGARYSATDVFEGIYAVAAHRRTCAALLAPFDALCVPSLPRIPTVAEALADPIGPNARLGRWTNFVNLLDLAALAVPGPFRTDDRPAGVTLIGPRGSDRALAGIGRSLHAAVGGPAAASEAQLPKGWTELAVVGAHMRGLPLNDDLVAAGGVFRRAVRTRACYRLYALSGPPPARPGLLRVGDADGHAIDAEVWALPAEGLGRLLASVPAPLSIGTVRLADATQPMGFLVEAAGTPDAADISALGSWRNFAAAMPTTKSAGLARPSIKSDG